MMPFGRRFICCASLWGICSVSGLAAAGQEALSPPLHARPDLRFEALEVDWRGDIHNHVVTVHGRFEDLGAPVHYEQRVRQEEGRWVTTGDLTIPPSRLESLEFVQKLVPALADWEGGGTVGFTATLEKAGEGWQASGTLSLSEVVLRHEPTQIEVAGVHGRIHWRFADGIVSTVPGQVLTFSSIQWEDVETGAGEAEWQLLSPEQLRVDLAVLHWAGGRISAGQFSFNPTEPDVSVLLHAHGVRLEELLTMLPKFEARGEGVIDGRLSLRIRPDGVRLEPGQLSLRPGVTARLQLPPRAWFTEGMSPGQPNFENLRMVERALEDLSLSHFRIDFLSPEEAEADLRLQIAGQSAAKDLPAAPINLTLNVHGPIRDLGNWFLNPRVSMGLQ